MKDSAACACTPEVLAMCSFPMQKWCEPYKLNAGKIIVDFIRLQGHDCSLPFCCISTSDFS